MSLCFHSFCYSKMFSIFGQLKMGWSKAMKIKSNTAVWRVIIFSLALEWPRCQTTDSCARALKRDRRDVYISIAAVMHWWEYKRGSRRTTERWGLHYCVPTLLTTNKLIPNVTNLNQELDSEHYYSITKQSTLRKDMSQVLNEMLIRKHLRTAAYFSMSCNKIIMLVGSWKGMEILVITNIMKALLNSKKNSGDIFKFYV